MKKRLITLLLALVMIIGMMPVCALAEDAEPTINVSMRGQLWQWPYGSFSMISRSLFYQELVCQKCKENMNHTGHHAVLASDIKALLPTFQATVDRVASDSRVVIGISTQHDYDNNKTYSVHTFDEYQDTDWIEILSGNPLYYIAVPVSGSVDVNCVTEDSGHETKTYNLTKGSFTAMTTGKNAAGEYTCTLTITKEPYVSKYNTEYTETHKDTDPETTTVTLDLYSYDYDDEGNKWWRYDARPQINVKCPSDGYNPVSPILAALNKTAPKLNTRDHFAYVQGYPDGTVKPAGSITRAEVAAILFRLMDADSRSLYYATASGFRDVDSTKWYNTYVATLNNAGVITDSRTGYFRPNDAITRAELAAMLAQFAEKKSAAIYFSDVSAGYWAANAIALTANLGWINGYPDGTFGPDKTVTRAELMAMVNRATGRAPESTSALLSGMKTWKDNADTARWYYLDVQEATNSHTYTGAPTETWTSLTATPDWSQYE